MKKNQLILLGILIVIIVLIIIVVTQKTESVNSGIFGMVSYGPITPVCMANQPCYKPYVGELIVKNKYNILVSTTQTDSSGKFRINLNSGDYSIETSTKFISRCYKEFYVDNTFSEVDLNCDTGIR